MKILFVLPNNLHGGAEQYLKMIASYFKEDQVTIVFLNKKNSNFWDDLKNITTQHHYSEKNEIIGFIKFALSTLFGKRMEYDYIFTSHVYTNGLIGFFLSINKITVKKFIARESTSIFIRYKGLPRFVYKMMYRYGYKKMNLLICQTELMKQQLLKNIPYLSNRTNIRVLENPIDLNYINTKSDGPNPINIEGKYIVSAGRLIYEKGFDNLIKAYNDLKRLDENLKLVILGEGELKSELLDLVKKLNIKDSVIFTGHVNNVYPYFKNAKLCVVSSRIEGFPNVLLQMMSQNDKVVSTLCAGGIQNIDGLFTCESDNIKALSDVMYKCLIAKTKTNKTVFDEQLNLRSIDQYIHQINKFVE